MGGKLVKHEMVVRYSKKCALKNPLLVLKVRVCAKHDSVVVEKRS
jgi:hypothetical protein